MTEEIEPMADEEIAEAASTGAKDPLCAAHLRRALAEVRRLRVEAMNEIKPKIIDEEPHPCDRCGHLGARWTLSDEYLCHDCDWRRDRVLDRTGSDGTAPEPSTDDKTVCTECGGRIMHWGRCEFSGTPLHGSKPINFSGDGLPPRTAAEQLADRDKLRTKLVGKRIEVLGTGWSDGTYQITSVNRHQSDHAEFTAERLVEADRPVPGSRKGEGK